MLKNLKALAGLAGVLVASIAAGALAAKPEPWTILFQKPESPVMEQIVRFNDYVSIVIILITLFVLALLIIVVVKFNEKANPTPSKTTHNTWLEVAWTVIPVFILVAIGIPSVRILFFMDKNPAAEMTLKVTGHQWYWSYEYPDHGNFSFDSVMVPDADIKDRSVRLLEVDNRIVLPVETDIRLLFTSEDVIHAWAIPALVAKIDAVPGRINESWVRINRPGIYYGQCSELCGVNHGFMPIAVEAVSKEAFKRWTDDKKKQAAGPSGVEVAADAARPTTGSAR